MRAKYRRRALLVFAMALVLGFLLGWIVYGRVMDDRIEGKQVLSVETAAPTEEPTPGPAWFDDGAEETGAPTQEPAATEDAFGANVTPEPSEAGAGLSGFVSGFTDALARSAATADASPAPAETAPPAAEETPAAPVKGSIQDPVFIGEPFSFVAQINEDGEKRTELTDAAYYDIPMTVTLSRYLLPDYYAQTYATQYRINGDEAGAQLDLSIGSVEGLQSVSVQDAVLAVFEDADGQSVQGYKFTNAEIGGESRSDLKVDASGTIFKRFKYDPAMDLRFLTITYYIDGQPTTVYFSLTESVLPEETPAPDPEALEPTPQPAAAEGDNYTVGAEGDGVRKLQQKLIDLGYLSGKPDGKFGKWTGEAVKAAQKDMGLEETGIADPAFREALYKR